MEFSVYFFSANDDNSFGDRYRFILDVARTIDSLGFAAIWTPERHFQEFGGSFPNPSVLSAALAVTTERLELRAGSVVLPHHHPVRVAEEWALVDQLSQGRAALCVATGWHSGDFVFYPENYDKRRDVAFDTIPVLRRLWAGERVEFPGPGGDMLPVRTYPRPHRAELPLWIVHSSNPQTWITAGELGTNVLTLVDSWERLEDNIARYRQAREEAGHDPEAGVVTAGMHTYVGEDEEKTRDLVAEPVRRYLGTFLNQKSNDASSASMTPAEKEEMTKLVAEDFYQRRSLLGTQEKCASVVRRAQAAGVNEIACMVDFGLPFSTILDALPGLDRLRAQFVGTSAPSRRDRTAPPAGRVTSAAQTAVAAGSTPNSMGWYYDR
ncbi:MupA/Atu3671 family FMN-dependent luciferase-like monooxygenase [Streptomyces oceani]|uniref:MupA/Atu3671 family FMN-dependent luciferase-like monooxygenase n=1 Tax=Streptomyces oceani TaxID=1075402 RepID=UPI000871F898|nr:MupA/Atu3671 family FMN-dependent luciferase-like monooxygenase [Streptomyces oceani]